MVNVIIHVSKYILAILAASYAMKCLLCSVTAMNMTGEAFIQLRMY